MEIDTAINEAIKAAPGSTTMLLAHEVTARLREENPSELADWLDAHAESYIRMVIQKRMNSRRSWAQRNVRRRAFRDAAEDGPEALSVFLETHIVDNQFTRKTIGDMTGADHRYVAGCYEEAAKESALYGHFHRAVAKRVGRRRTADVLSEQQYRNMLQAIGGTTAA